MRCDEIGVRINRNVLTDFLNGARPGQFFHVRGYVDADGEKSDYFLRFGIKYANLKARDVGFLYAVLAGEKTFEVHVQHNVWIPKTLLATEKLFAPGGRPEDLIHVQVTHDVPLVGAELTNAVMRVTKDGYSDLLDVVKWSNRKGGDKVKAAVSYTLPSTHPLVISAIGEHDLQGTLLKGLLAPRQDAVAPYEREGQSAYSLEKDGATRWYLRDVLEVSKVIREEGVHPFEASLPLVAVKNAIRFQHLLTGKYRQFILTDGQFEAVTIEGQSILCDGINEEFYFALPETVRQAVAVA